VDWPFYLCRCWSSCAFLSWPHLWGDHPEGPCCLTRWILPGGHPRRSPSRQAREECRRLGLVVQWYACHLCFPPRRCLFESIGLAFPLPSPQLPLPAVQPLPLPCQPPPRPLGPLV
jgi:hypothetical protein